MQSSIADSLRNDILIPLIVKVPLENHDNNKTSLNGVDLSFANVREYERTKHVHRLHPYLGKFIPQLVKYFLDSHRDNFKKETP